MEFMVLIKNTYPADGDKEILASLTKAESLRASVLASEGIIVKIWRRTGQKSNVGIWVAKIIHFMIAEECILHHET